VNCARSTWAQVATRDMVAARASRDRR
jgi:hypothetical protein